jgi:hypothetical protein
MALLNIIKSRRAHVVVKPKAKLVIVRSLVSYQVFLFLSHTALYENETEVGINASADRMFHKDGYLG